MYCLTIKHFDFVQERYWCGSQLWRGRIKIVCIGA